MTAANIPNTIVNLTPADAVPVQQNFAYVETFLNSEVINRDGSVAMTGPLSLPEAPTQTLQAATKGYVDAFFPVGIMFLYPGDVAPAGDWMLCQGQAMSTSSFPALFAVLGYRYGGSGASFNLPDLRNRVPIGKDATVADVDTTGKTGGTTSIPLLAHTHTHVHTHTIAHTHEHNHTHTINHNHDNADLPSHLHSGVFNAYDLNPGSFWVAQRPAADGGTVTNVTQTSGNLANAIDIPTFIGASGAPSDSTTGASSAANSGAASVSTTSEAGTAAVTSRQPFQVVNYIIRTK